MPARSRRRERARAAAAAASAAAGPAPARPRPRAPTAPSAAPPPAAAAARRPKRSTPPWPARPSGKRTRSVRTCRPTPRSRRACPPPARTRTRRPRSRPAPRWPRRRPARTTSASRSRPAPRATSRTRTGRTAAGSAEPPLRRLRLLVAYDGGAFTGFARQPDRRTVQGELEAVLARLARAPVETVGAGRTDAGVHAHGQVVHADVPARLDPARVRRALNAALGPAVVVRVADWAPDGFDARFSAVRRHYRYRIDDSGDPDPLTRSFVLAWRPRAWWASTTSPPSAAPAPAPAPPAACARYVCAVSAAWSRCAWWPMPSAGRWCAASSATCSPSATAAATPPAPPPCSPAATGPPPARSPRPTAWSSRRSPTHPRWPCRPSRDPCPVAVSGEDR